MRSTSLSTSRAWKKCSCVFTSRNVGPLSLPDGRCSTMFRTVWSKTLREYRVAIPGWGIGLGLLLCAEFTSTTTLDPATLSTVGQLAHMIRLFGDPLAFTTPAGYVTFRDFGIFLPIPLSIWAVLAVLKLCLLGLLFRMLALPLRQVRGSQPAAAGWAGLLLGLR